MPYIQNDRRMKFMPGLSYMRDMMENDVISAGDLNYIITSLLKIELDKEGISYTKLNELLGVLEGVKLELYRKVAAGYEDVKEAENGKVY